MIILGLRSTLIFSGYYKWYLTTAHKKRFWRSFRRALSPTRSRSRERRHSSRSIGRRDSSNDNASAPVDVVYGSEQASTQIFAGEIRDSMRTVLESDDHASNEHVRKLILEINSSKLAYNISMENVAKFVFLSFLSLTQVEANIAGFKQVV